VLSLPALGRAQNEKVVEYIRTAGIPLVLLTTDEEFPHTGHPRPNVADEMRICAEYRLKDTIVLKESSKTRRVSPASNVEGVHVTYNFDRSKFEQVIPYLLKEVIALRPDFGPAQVRKNARSHWGVAAPVPISRGQADAYDKVVVRDFVNQMDVVWDNEFEPLWRQIYTIDGQAERRLAHDLDKFFQLYDNLVAAWANGKLTGRKLSEEANRAIEKAAAMPIETWQAAAESRKDRAEAIRQDPLYHKRAKAHEPIFQLATSRLAEGVHGANIPRTVRVERLRLAIEKFEEYMTALRTAQ